MGAVDNQLNKDLGTRALALYCLAMVLTLLMYSAQADEGGVAFWLSGQYASLAAVPPSPGWSLPTSLYYYSGRSQPETIYDFGESLVVGQTSQETMLLLTPTYALQTKWFGGQPSFGLGIGYGMNRVQADYTLSATGSEQYRQDNDSGLTDIAPIVSLAWSHGVHNTMVYLTGNIPVGSYDSQRLANIGIGHAALDAGGGYTYLNALSGLEFSVVAGFTYNFENQNTDYQNGIDSHLGWGVSLFLGSSWELGVVGYVYYQLTADGGSGDSVGAFKSRVAAIGPQIGYTFNVGGQTWNANLRGYYEFCAENRPEGYALFLTLGIPLGGKTR